MQTYDVVIPAWNAARTLKETLQSVLVQSAPPRRVIVVDDGSTDETVMIARGFGSVIEVFQQKNSGPGAACSYGISLVTAPVLAMVDADDLWLPQKMERQLAVLVAAEKPSAIFCRQRQFIHGFNDDGCGEERSGLNRSSLVLKSETARMIGEIRDPVGGRGDMIDWLQRARGCGVAFVELTDVLVLRRVISGSLSSGRDPDRNRGYLAIAHAAMLRNRAQKQV